MLANNKTSSRCIDMDTTFFKVLCLPSTCHFTICKNFQESLQYISMCISTGTPVIINFPFISNGKLIILDVPKFRHITVSFLICSKSTEYPCAPPSTPRVTRSNVHEELEEDNLVHISVLLVDKNSQEYVEKYNEVRGCEIWGFSC